MFLDGWFKNTMETEMNTLHRSLQNLQLYPVSPHSLPDESKTTQNNLFWSQSSQYSLLNTQQQEWVYELIALFLQVLFKVSAFCTGTLLADVATDQ